MTHDTNMPPERTPGTPEYYRHRHARCKPCSLFFTWLGRSTIGATRCTRCGRPLTRTTGALLSLTATRTAQNQGAHLAVGSPHFTDTI